MLAEGAERASVVLTDVVMPGISGVDLAREIRRRWPALPVVLTSGYAQVLAEEGRDGFEFLHKPYSVEELTRVLRRARAASHRIAESSTEALKFCKVGRHQASPPDAKRRNQTSARQMIELRPGQHSWH